jgi:hypothetical protein
MAENFQALETEWAGIVQRQEADVEDVRTYGDVAIVKARLRWLARTEGRSLNGTYAVTDVFTNDQGRWRASWRISIRLTDR